jgi:hypothetical protein
MKHDERKVDQENVVWVFYTAIVQLSAALVVWGEIEELYSSGCA